MRTTSFLDRLFKAGENHIHKSNLINEPATVFTRYSGDAYANDIFSSAVDSIARNAGKLKGSHVITSGSGNVDKKLNNLLQISPNPYMSAYDLQYKVATHYYLLNNAFIFIARDTRGNITGFYPITAVNAQILSDQDARLFCRFTMRNGKTTTLPYCDIIHLRRRFNSNDVLGDSNDAIEPVLELAHTQNEGIINGIKAGASIRGILNYTQLMSPQKLKEEKDAFVRDYLQFNNDGGVIATDQKMTYQPIESKPTVIDADQSRAVAERIYNYLGTSEKIVNSSYTEDEFSAFYESTLEPLALQIGLEFTRKVFNERERAYGNSIIFESGRMNFTSNKTKVELIKEIMPLGLLSINQALEILNLPAIEDGEKRLQTLNVIDARLANVYQANGTNGKGSVNNGEEEAKTE